MHFERPFKMHKSIIVSRKKMVPEKKICVPYLKFSDLLSKTHFLFGLIQHTAKTFFVANLRTQLRLEMPSIILRKSDNYHKICCLLLCLFLFVCFCCFTSHVNSYGHCGTVSSLNHTFSWASLNKQLTSTSCTYFRL